MSKNKQPTPARFFYKQDNVCIYYDEGTKSFGQIGNLEKNKDNKTRSYFELFKGYEKSHDGILAFYKKFHEDCNELAKYGIVYNKYLTHYDAVYLNWQRYTTRQMANIILEEVSMDEFEYIEGCYNGGIIYLAEEYKNKTTLSYGYDYSAFYPNTLIHPDLYIAKGQGTKMKLTELNWLHLHYGIYRVNITSNHPHVRKVFAFSKAGYYTHYSMQFAYKYKNELDFTFQLEENCNWNVIVYQEQDLVSCKNIASCWFQQMNKVKQECKGNKLIKHLMSSLWGTICKYRKHYFTIDQFYKEADDENMKIINDIVRTNGSHCLECVDLRKPYKYPYARIKPFWLSLARNTMGDLIMENDLLEDVFRVHTDNITLKGELEFPEGYYPVPEEKTTGLIYWQSVNSYKKAS